MSISRLLHRHTPVRHSLDNSCLAGDEMIFMSLCQTARRLALACLLLLSSSVRSQAPFIQTKAHRNVCTLPYTTVDICGATNGTVDDFTGYEPEVN